MDKIKEVMGLVMSLSVRSMEYHAGKKKNEHIEILMEKIESKLRELLAREPLRDRRIGEIAVECDDGQDGMEYLIAFARSLERAHGIGNESKGM